MLIIVYILVEFSMSSHIPSIPAQWYNDGKDDSSPLFESDTRPLFAALAAGSCALARDRHNPGQ
jgi:hypothetical protein